MAKRQTIVNNPFNTVSQDAINSAANTPTVQTNPPESTDSYSLSKAFIPISGTEVRVILEFPQVNIGRGNQSLLIVLDDVVSLSYSIYRAKPSVTPLGSSSIIGYGLGSRTVAGSIIRHVFTTDKLTNLQVQCYLAQQDSIAKILSGSDDSMGLGMPFKDKIAFMKDDLTSFNIHTFSVSETQYPGDPGTRYETIYGAVMINNGQVYSIEDLVTETTVSFQAKAVRTATNITDYNRGFSSSPKLMTASRLAG